MRDTGQFYLIGVDGMTRADGTLLQVTRVDGRCLACQRQFRVTTDHGLLDLDGAAVVTCPACGNRQAISRAQLEDLRRSAE